MQIFEELGSPIDGYSSTLILGMAQLMGGILCLSLVHWTGKRPLTMISTIGSSLCFFIVAVYAFIKQHDEESIRNVTWIPLVFLNTAAFMTHICIRLLPWMLIGEVIELGKSNIMTCTIYHSYGIYILYYSYYRSAHIHDILLDNINFMIIRDLAITNIIIWVRVYLKCNSVINNISYLLIIIGKLWHRKTI